MEGQKVVVEAHNLVRRFGDFTAVDGIAFKVHRGEIYGFLGPNGSGKTTTIRMLLGLLPPSQGEARVLGLPVADQAGAIRPHVGYMSQRFSLYNDLTVIENLRFTGRIYGMQGETLAQRIEEALRMSDLEGREHVRTRALSGGWRQRLALSAAILHRPELVFLDEPTAGVDPRSRRAFWDLLYDLVASGTTVFVTTHYMDEAEHCHRLAFLQRGRIIAQGSPVEIKSQWIHSQVLELSADDASQAVAVLRQAQGLDLDRVLLFGARVRVLASDVADRRQEIRNHLDAAGIKVESMQLVEPTLEDVFVACMQ